MSEAAVDRTRWTSLWRRWPTALAVGFAALTLTGEEPAEAVAEILPLLPLEYLIIAKLGRRTATWPVVGVLLAVTFALMEQETVPPSSVFAALALVVMTWGTVDPQLVRPGEFRIQSLGMVGFGALALVGLVVDPDVGRYVVATGWLLHGVWDFVHLSRDKVVTRSYAEWCGVLDVLIAAGLVFLV